MLYVNVAWSVVLYLGLWSYLIHSMSTPHKGVRIVVSGWMAGSLCYLYFLALQALS